MIRDLADVDGHIANLGVAALIRDLKGRGLLDETLVIWGGEFGRSPFREGHTASSPAAASSPA